jgi:amino acid transporter
LTSQATKFGTFGGVFTPCVLTILGVIMFLRFGQVVGQSGLMAAVGIVVAAKLITTLTAFSLSAIATNTRVRGGGAYFLISRSLGVEFGSVIGVVFFLAQAVSVSMYVIGFTEAFVDAFPQSGFSFVGIATTVNIITFICVIVGAGWTIKVQYFILAILILSILAFAGGAIPHISLANLHANMAPSYQPGESLFTMFALFFPAVTGIMAGANMSGDLESPSRSIPKGTIGAIGATTVVYLAMALLLGAAGSRDALINDPMIVKNLSLAPVLIIAGVFAATISSALGSMMGAPRILQAFARDDIFSSLKFFARGSGKNAEPRRAIVATFIIAQAGIMLGDLNAIAPVITMFFMITYGTLNLACFYEGITRNPSYRPTFRFSHWSIALIGAVGCFAVMFLMNPVWAIAAIGIMAVLYWWIGRAELRARWGDVGSGVAFERARRALLKLENEYFHPKNWRPAILALSGGAWNRFHLAEYAYWLAAGHGILTLAHIFRDETDKRVERRRQAERRLRAFISEEGLSAFPVVVVDPSLPDGLDTLLQSHGIGGMRSNTVLLGVPHNEERFSDFAETLRIARSYERSIVLVDCEEEGERWETPDGSIDVLWRGTTHGQLMVLLAHLLKKNPEWRTRAFRILAVLPPKGDAENMHAELDELLTRARIDATVHVFGGDDLYVTLARRTGNSAVLFVPFDPPTLEEESEFFDWLQKIGKLVPDIIHVHSAQDVSLEA